jgi:hypothetical protein
MYWHCPTRLPHWTWFRLPLSTWTLWLCRRIKLFDDDTVHTDALSSKEGALTIPSSIGKTIQRDWNQLLYVSIVNVVIEGNVNETHERFSVTVEHLSVD